MIKLVETYFGMGEQFFEKLDGNGNKMDYTSKRSDGVRVIHDTNTGLYWEVKSENPNDINYCEDKYFFEDAQNTYVDKLNSANYGYFSDWRIPNKDELRSILDYGIEELAVDVDVFENCQCGDYWTKNTYQMQPYFGWVIYFGFGGAIAKSKETERFVIACRGGKEKLFGEMDESRFIDNGDGTITDNATGLMWQKGENQRMDLNSAKQECKKMRLGGYDDWRVPNIKEINTILNLSYDNNWWYFKNVFPADGLEPPLLHYFSSSSFKNHYAWVTNFCFGYDGYYGSVDAKLLFRACRDTQKDVKNEFKLPHTGQITAYDVEGKAISLDNQMYKGLDASRITDEVSYEILCNGNVCSDKNTGLMWQTVDNNEKYTYFTASDYIESLNSSHSLGFSDWRLPSREELRTIVNYNDCIPSTDLKYFPNIKADFYWAKEENKLDKSRAWGIYFGYGCAISFPKDNKGYVMAVRGVNVFDIPYKERYVDNGDGTITDKSLNIMWVKDESDLLSLTEALKYCSELEFAGYNDWNLPNMKEMSSLIYLREESDSWFIPELFPNTVTKPQGFYMASTTFDATFGWGNNFQFGFDGYYADRKKGKYPFRAVRKI